jgi:hypothetical protein
VPGCTIFTVYAQNRFAPLGAAVRVSPDLRAAKSDRLSFAPNEAIPVDGWEHTGTPTYPDNTPPLNNDVWYHVAPLGESTAENDADFLHAWVSFPAVRGGATSPDPTGGHSTKLGKLAPMPADCEMTAFD